MSGRTVAGGDITADEPQISILVIGDACKADLDKLTDPTPRLSAGVANNIAVLIQRAMAVEEAVKVVGSLLVIQLALTLFASAALVVIAVRQ